MPQIFLDDELVGGFDEFSSLLRKNGPDYFLPK
jgi:glutaredoxin